MTSPSDVAAFHAEYDRHPGERVRLFETMRDLLPATVKVLYPGSYIDIGPSVWFDDVTYVDVDKRAARFFATGPPVVDLVRTKRKRAGARLDEDPRIAFHHLDYRNELPLAERSVDLLVSLYAGFISEHCSRYLRPGGLLLANDSHGDASMATLDPDYRLVAVLQSRDGDVTATTTDLDTYLHPKRGRQPSVEELHETNRGIAYTRPASAYVFQRS